MEAYFHNDPRIVEWIDQITEKVFTVCLLTGIDADLEFQRGSQIVSKVSTILLGISMFPSELLEDGLRQVLEQQLPDDRVIKNFPSFYDILNKMLHQGITKALEGQRDEVKYEIDEIVKNKHVEEAQDRIIKEENRDSSEAVDKRASFESIEEAVDEIIANGVIIPALAPNNHSTDNPQEYPEGGSKKDLSKNELGPAQKDLKFGNEQDSKGISMHTVHLKHVLNRIFPNSPVRWNITINGQKFEAQAENILIYFSDSEHSGFSEESFKKEGLKVFICNPEDLLFPRRVEREIREILRSGKKSLIV